MQQIEHRATPAGELGHEDHIDLASLGEAEDLLTLFTVIFGAGRSLLPDTGNLVARLLGEGLEVALLTRARLIGGRYPAIKRGGLSQLNPRVKDPNKWHFSCSAMSIRLKCTSKETLMPSRETPEPQGRPLSELSEIQRDRAMARFAVLRPHLEDGAALAQAARAA